MDYRWGGKRRTLALGVYPMVSLAEAREKRNQAKKLLASGIDPSAQRKLERLLAKAAADNTFRLVSEEWLGKLAREGRAAATLGKITWLLELAYPEIGERPVAAITPPELLTVLRKVEARGHYETARRLRSTCGQVFRYAISTGRAERDPSADLRGALTAPRVKHRAAVTDPKAIGAMLRAIDGYNGQPITLAALRLAPLLFVRPGELRRAEWSEFDLDGAEWRIPAAKMKMRLPHRVPLSRQAVAILRDLHRITGHGQYLFPSIRTTRRPISENTLNAALRRLGYSKDEATTHGFRSTAAVRLNETRQWSADAIERQLAHQEANSVRRAYTHAAEFWPERREMMQVWADQLDQWREGAKVTGPSGAMAPIGPIERCTTPRSSKHVRTDTLTYPDSLGAQWPHDFDRIEYLVVRRFPFANALRGPPSLLSMAGGNAHADRQSGLPEIETYKEELRNKRPAELQKLYDEELAKEAAEQMALAESEEQSRFFNQPYAKADFGHWSKAAYWTLDEAIALSFGKAPEQVTSETMKPFVDVSPFAHQYWRRRDLALRAAASKQLSDPTLPGLFLAWAKRTDLAVPSELEAAVTARGIQIADWKTHYDDLKKKFDECQTQWLASSKEQSEQIDRLRS